MRYKLVSGITKEINNICIIESNRELDDAELMAVTVYFAAFDKIPEDLKDVVTIVENDVKEYREVHDYNYNILEDGKKNKKK